MTNDQKTNVWRAIALILFPLVITLASAIYAITVKDISKKYDNHEDRIRQIEPAVEVCKKFDETVRDTVQKFDTHEQRIRELEKIAAVRNEQMTSIIKTLERIEKKVDQK
jgi:hypothetical protein